MAKTIQMRASQQEKEARLVAGMYDKNWKVQSELYAYCSQYFWANYRGVFKMTAPSHNEGCNSSPKFKTRNDTTNIDTIAKYK